MSTAIQFFDEHADHYQADLRQTWSRNVTKSAYAYFDAVRAWRHTNPGVSVLDVCIGTGASSQLLLENRYDVHGIDSSPRMLELAAKNGFDKEKLKLADLTTQGLPYPDASFSIVLSSDSIFYLKNATDVVAEMFRVAQPGALVMIDPLIHKSKKYGVIECRDNTSNAVRLPSAHVQNADAFDKACRNNGGSKRQVLYSDPGIVNAIHCPVPAKHPVYAFIKR